LSLNNNKVEKTTKEAISNLEWHYPVFPPQEHTFNEMPTSWKRINKRVIS
jgi:hypothetical protein